jgi:pimeloyl-ACP methyl ester carboxylesterase
MIARQAQDAACLLRELGAQRAHVVGHSYGGVLALQLAVDAPDLVHSLALLEPALRSGPAGQAHLEQTVGPAREKYRAVDKRGFVLFSASGCSALPGSQSSTVPFLERSNRLLLMPMSLTKSSRRFWTGCSDPKKPPQLGSRCFRYSVRAVPLYFRRAGPSCTTGFRVLPTST